jgi:predicted transcriptional regulator
MGQKRRADFAEHKLSRRERQIMAVIYRLGKASIAELVANMPDPPSADAVRRMAHILEDKGLLRHTGVGPRNIYYPTVTPERASRTALGHLVETFFGGSPQKLVAALLDLKRDQLSDEELRRLAQMIDRASGEGKQS